MRFLVIVPASKESEAGELPSRDLLEKMGKYNEELVKAGVMLAGEGLHPTSRAKRVKFGPGQPSIIDGPFTESKELVAGFWIFKAKSLDEAVDWVKKAPFGGGVQIEVRPIFEAEEFGERLTPEMKERETRLRHEVEAARK
jgi:hypothetical protein